MVCHFSNTCAHPDKHTRLSKKTASQFKLEYFSKLYRHASNEIDVERNKLPLHCIRQPANRL